MYRKSYAVILVCGLVFFMSGYHAIDTAWNLHTINKALGTEYYDTTIGVTYTEFELYRYGLSMLFLGFFLSMISGIYLFEKPKKKKEIEDYETFISQ